MTKITQLSIALILIFSTHSFASSSNLVTSSTFTNGQSSQSSEIQRVRLDFTTPTGYVRHLLIGFTDNIATDGFDYGYDGRNRDSFPDDCSWLIENGLYVIQGVGAFNQSKKYPLAVILQNQGTIEFSLNSLENFESPIDVYIYDAVLDTYTNINEVNFTQNISSGEYLDRFYIAFQDDNAIEQKASLSIVENNIKSTTVKYLSNTKELYLNTNSASAIKQIQIYNIIGKELFSVTNLNESEIRIPMENLRTNYGIVSVTTEHGSISKKIILR